jgi:hypothetical protein
MAYVEMADITTSHSNAGWASGEAAHAAADADEAAPDLDLRHIRAQKEAAAMGHETGEEEVSRAADDGLRRQGQTRTSAIGAMLR